jgi:hypothetical protein
VVPEQWSQMKKLKEATLKLIGTHKSLENAKWIFRNIRIVIIQEKSFASYV